MTSPQEAGHRPTIYDVARQAGTSKSVVSRVLQGLPGVSEQRRTAVFAAIRELGYRPSQAATALAQRRTKNIEVLLDDYRNLWFVELLAGMRTRLATDGYHLTVADTKLNLHLIDGRTSISPSNIDGLVLGTDDDNPDLELWRGPTVVTGWRNAVPPNADMITNNDEAGGQMATEHLLQLGHRHIGHLTGMGGPATHRRNGYLAAMSKAGLNPRTVGDSGGTTEDDGFYTARALLDIEPRVTAIFAANDTMAAGAMAAIHAHQLTTPDDISIIGYDNSPIAKYHYLNLTSIDSRNHDVGAAAAQALIERIDNPGIQSRRTLLEPNLVLRTTTGPVNVTA